MGVLAGPKGRMRNHLPRVGAVWRQGCPGATRTGLSPFWNPQFECVARQGGPFGALPFHRPTEAWRPVLAGLPAGRVVLHKLTGDVRSWKLFGLRLGE
jgi:hypothetical protein